MPSAHGPIFCHKELREKVGVNVRFFIGVSQRTRTDILSKTKHRTYYTLRFLLSECHVAHKARFFIGAVVCDNGRRVFIGLTVSRWLSG